MNLVPGDGRDGSSGDRGLTTIRDVARQAGVGVGTVSRVLNDHPAVTAETRDRVRAAIASLDYHPSRVARALSRRRSTTVAVVVPFLTHASAVERLRGVIDAFDHQAQELVLFNVDQAERRPGAIARAARSAQAGAVLAVTLRPSSDELAELRSRGIPIVLVDAEADRLPTVVVDDVQGGRMAAQHLLALGHTRIGELAESHHPGFRFTSSGRRAAGFAAALAEAGAPLDPDLVRAGPHVRQTARTLALDLLDRDDRPTAVFAHSDTNALGVLEAARELGLQVPGDVSVLGFDDVEAASMLELSTIRQPLFESGRLGAERVLALLAGEPLPGPVRLQLPLEVVARRTTGPVPQGRPPRSRVVGASA
jgi:DNA-binding LacI/PurR family transcriptional regulator